MKKRATQGRGLFYTRDSGGKHEMTPSQYVNWAGSEAARLGVTFDGTPAVIDRMLRNGESQCGDLFADFGVQGHKLSRTGLDALFAEVLADSEVSHVFIPRRDRLARPDDPIDGVQLENVLRRAGVTVVYMERTCPAIPRGKRQEIGDLLTALIDFEKSGKDRRELADKIIKAQIALARLGYSTGGRPPFGFRRWLVKETGEVLRQLAEGEHVRMRGHHVVWLPYEPELQLVRRILAMLKTMPGSRVAAILNAEGIPSPDAGRWRTDKCGRHQVSGLWHQPTISGIARNKLLQALSQYGRRSMGDQLRLGDNGPRELDEADYRIDEEPKVVRNPESVQIVAPAKFEALVDPDDHQQLLNILDRRGGSQRGKPRSPNPDQNSLGSRVFDMNCCWPMYRVPHSKSYRYTCGYYQQSHGSECAHNHVDGPSATRFVLSVIRQRAVQPHLLPHLELELQDLSKNQVPPISGPDTRLRAELEQVRGQLQTAKRNLALAKTAEQFETVAAVFEELLRSEKSLSDQLCQAETAAANQTVDLDQQIQYVLDMVRNLPQMLDGSDSSGRLAREVFEAVNARLFISFERVQAGKRLLNRVKSGVVTIGDTAPPITPYAGPTSRHKVKGPAAAGAGGPFNEIPPPTEPFGPGGEGNSLGNVNRGDSRCTIHNETVGLGLVLGLIANRHEFSGDEVLNLVEPGLYRKIKRSG